ncbi:hypothetical protein [Mesorhizobium sp. M4B.F.Ca.ET.058.02.1.1]|uniref:hypothetical protein n=1 Tax=Mesorhizobium sp. M4B.F.Ca.ET.058.02.1.1 TaxID=2493675 RepID=UPI00167D2AB0|nr:hypothetical protein [Mesorhizobium sp. M4B.F.Ca.ET.058.02.1.1]
MPPARYETIILYSRKDAFGDGLLRIPALRAARTAFPDSLIVYGTTQTCTLETAVNDHVRHLVDTIRAQTPLAHLVASHRKGKGQLAIVDFRIVAPWLVQTWVSLLGRGIVYEANFPAFALSWPPAMDPKHDQSTMHGATTALSNAWRESGCLLTIGWSRLRPRVRRPGAWPASMLHWSSSRPMAMATNG